MDRLEKVREYVDGVFMGMPKHVVLWRGFNHMYGVSQYCTLIALKRKENVELAAIAGMLHDIYTYSTMDARDHAHKGAKMAKKILGAMKLFTGEEIEMVCQAIYNHSDKETVHDSFDEVLIDADVMEHCLYDPSYEPAPHERGRFEKLRGEFGL